MEILEILRTTEGAAFAFFALLTAVSAVGVVIAKSPVYAAMNLVACFFFLAGIYPVGMKLVVSWEPEKTGLQIDI